MKYSDLLFCDCPGLRRIKAPNIFLNSCAWIMCFIQPLNCLLKFLKQNNQNCGIQSHKAANIVTMDHIFHWFLDCGNIFLTNTWCNF